MRIFKTTTGGSPIYLDDLAFIADGLDQYLGAMVDALGDNFTLTGAQISDGGSSWDNTAGFIVLGGQICKVNAGSVIKPNTSMTPEQDATDQRGTYWQIVEDTDLDSSRTLLTGSTFAPYRTRRARLVTSNTVGAYTQGSTGWHYTTVKTIDGAIWDLIQAKITPFLLSQWSSKVVLPGDLLNGWTYGADGIFLIEKDLNNWVRIIASIDGTVGNNVHFYTVPAEYAPLSTALLGGGAYQTPGVAGNSQDLGSWVTLNGSTRQLHAGTFGLTKFAFSLMYKGS